MEDLKIYIYNASNKFDRPIRRLIGDSAQISISENDFIFIEIITKRILADTIYIWLSDYRFNISFERKIDELNYYSLALNNLYDYSEKEKFSNNFLIEGFNRQFFKLFLNYYGLCEIEVEYKQDENIVYQKFGVVEIFSEKIGDIVSLLEYLFEKDFFFWNIISLTKALASEKEKITDNIFWKLCSIKEIVRQLSNDFLINVSYDKIYKLSPESKLKEWNLDENITESSLLWILENLGSLEQTNSYDENHFLILKRPYKSKTTYSETLVRDTDVYENRLIHWFVTDLYNFIFSSKKIIKEKYEEYAKDTANLKQTIYTGYYRRLLDFVNTLDSEIGYIKSALNRAIPVKNEQISSIEHQRLHSKPHYYNIYLLLVRWVDNRQVDYYPNFLFSGLKDISKLYEIFCLFKIIDAIVDDLGFTPFENSNHKNVSPFFSDGFFSEKNEIISKYEYKRESVLLNLYYENLPDSLVTIAKTGGRDYKPDFIIEIVYNGIKYFIILDAKYKKIYNIENYEYSELCLKYLHGIGPKEGGFFNALALIIINPIIGGNLNYYHRQQYNIKGLFKSFPAIARLEMGMRKGQGNFLAELLSDILNYIDSN